MTCKMRIELCNKRIHPYECKIPHSWLKCLRQQNIFVWNNQVKRNIFPFVSKIIIHRISQENRTTNKIVTYQMKRAHALCMYYI